METFYFRFESENGNRDNRVTLDVSEARPGATVTVEVNGKSESCKVVDVESVRALSKNLRSITRAQYPVKRRLVLKRLLTTHHD